MYELKDGERVVDDGTPVIDESTKFRRKKKKRRAAGGMMPMAGAPKKKKSQPKPKTAAELKKEEDEARKKIENSIVGGKKGAPKEEEKDDDGEKENYKEITVGKRWVVLTGTIDHKKLRDNYLLALKRPEVAHPHYKRLDVERQTLQPDGSWSDWEAPDSDRNYDVLENLPEEEEEWTPESVRIKALVDSLPFLKAGTWEHVHIGSLVPAEKLEVPKPAAEGGMPGMPPPTSMSSMKSPPAMKSTMPSSEMRPGAMSGPGMMLMPGMSSSGGGETIDYETTEADVVMLRSLDFTVDPDTTYHYRVRIVVYNPNFGREDVNPGIDTAAKSLFGPWSAPTDDVTMPADVSAYALRNASSGKDGQVLFQVTRWDPADGITVVKDFDAGPGEVVGEDRIADIPSSEGKGVKQRKVDFVSRQVVLDVVGGKKPLPPIGLSGAPLDVPPLTLLVRSDGAILLRNSALDSKDEVRSDIEANYKKEKEESGKERESAMGSNSMMGMYGGGMPGSRQSAAMPGRPAGGGFR